VVAEQQISLWFAAASYGLLDGMTDGGLGSVLKARHKIVSIANDYYVAGG
jgi:hypothetical protein